MDLATLLTKDALAHQIVTRTRVRILQRPRNQQELNDFYRIVRELSDYGGKVGRWIEAKVEREKYRLLQASNHEDERRIFWEHWDFFIPYLHIHRAYLSFGGFYFENGEPSINADPEIGWVEYLPALISFGTLLRSKVAPPGASAAHQAEAKLWHLSDCFCLGTSMDAHTYFHNALAPPSDEEIQQYGLRDLIPREVDTSEWLDGMGDAEQGGVEDFQRMFKLKEWEDPYQRPQ
ncbi:MAG: hypothetical protein Q9180_001336 [Flavoplaca navasiana]